MVSSQPRPPWSWQNKPASLDKSPAPPRPVTRRRVERGRQALLRESWGGPGRGGAGGKGRLVCDFGVHTDQASGVQARPCSMGLSRHLTPLPPPPAHSGHFHPCRHPCLALCCRPPWNSSTEHCLARRWHSCKCSILYCVLSCGGSMDLVHRARELVVSDDIAGQPPPRSAWLGTQVRTSAWVYDFTFRNLL